MIDTETLCAIMRESSLARWAKLLPSQMAACRNRRHGDFDVWIQHIEALPQIPAQRVELDRDCISA
ncbi:MAG: DUF1698 domain-containing protein, partial [Chromatiaceae bacterium]|nr:DUF1698 domain-containing protein [Chromatiaceae bacterium]MCP5428624.1 DUF1698 domain-containing protein [Chromatiaceae bacterium]